MQAVSRYTRRYLHTVANPDLPGSEELDFDGVTELWFERREVYEQVLAHAARGVLPQEVIADEEQLFDRSRTRFCAVEECESVG